MSMQDRGVDREPFMPFPGDHKWVLDASDLHGRTTIVDKRLQVRSREIQLEQRASDALVCCVESWSFDLPRSDFVVGVNTG